MEPRGRRGGEGVTLPLLRLPLHSARFTGLCLDRIICTVADLGEGPAPPLFLIQTKAEEEGCVT